MGESKLKRMRDADKLLSCAGVQTAGGRVHVRWEAESAATPMGQLAFFIEFLTLTGLCAYSDKAMDSDSTASWTRIPEQAGQSERSDAGFYVLHG